MQKTCPKDQEDSPLVIDVMEDISPEYVEVLGIDHEAANGHPKAVCEGGCGERDDEYGAQRDDKDDE